MSIPLGDGIGRRHSDSPQRSYVVRFGAALSLFVVLAIVADLRNATFRGARSLDFKALSPGEVFVGQSINAYQHVGMKIGYAERMTPPKVGLFGGHQGQHFRNEDFGEGDDYFFNYFTLIKPSLFEVRDFIAYLARRDKLPTETVIVHVFTPANMWDRRYLTYQGANPLDITFQSGELYSGPLDKLRFAGMAGSALLGSLKQILNYQRILVAYLGGGKAVRMDVPTCRSIISGESRPLTGWRGLAIKVFPVTVLNILGAFDVLDYCRHPQLNSQLQLALYRDGAMAWSDFMNPGAAAPFVDNNSYGRLTYGDDQIIADVLRDIHRIVARAGRRLVFYIPPLLRAGPHRPGAVDRIVDAALKRVPEIPVVDHRAKAMAVADFHDAFHPRAPYYRALVAELRARRLLGPARDQNLK